MAVRGHPGSIPGFHRWIGARYRYLIHLPRKPLDNFKMSLVSTEHSRKLPQNISSEFIYGWILKNTHIHLEKNPRVEPECLLAIVKTAINRPETESPGFLFSRLMDIQDTYPSTYYEIREWDQRATR